MSLADPFYDLTGKLSSPPGRTSVRFPVSRWPCFPFRSCGVGFREDQENLFSVVQIETVLFLFLFGRSRVCLCCGQL